MKRLIIFIVFVFFSCTDLFCQNITFGVVADVQYCDCDNEPQYNRFFAEVKDRLTEARDTLNNYSLDFAINLGDIIEKDWKSFDDILPIFDEFQTRRYHVLGNHDFWVHDEKKPLVSKRLGMKAPYYSFTLKDWRFIILDSNDYSIYAHPEGTSEYLASEAMIESLAEQEKVQARPWNGGIGHEQLTWLKRQLEKAKDENQKVLLFSHIPLQPLNMNTLWNYQEVLTLIEGYDCVKAVFAGHYHNGNNVKHNGIHHFTFKGMLDTPDQNSFSVVELQDEAIIIKGFGRQKGAVLSISSNL